MCSDNTYYKAVKMSKSHCHPHVVISLCKHFILYHVSCVLSVLGWREGWDLDRGREELRPEEEKKRRREELDPGELM